MKNHTHVKTKKPNIFLYCLFEVLAVKTCRMVIILAVLYIFQYNFPS